jgi:thymidylate synthase (FAD)
MKLIKPSYEIWNWNIDNKLIEKCGRVCYQSEPTGDSDNFIKKIVDRGHESVIEHSSATVSFTVDRGFSHELVRMRLASYSQESTRYCTYESGCTFIIPLWVDIEPGTYDQYILSKMYNESTYWFDSMLDAEKHYQMLLCKGWAAQKARAVLPNSLKTQIVMTANAREWRHVFKLRCAQASHPQMREIMVPLAKDFAQRNAVLFGEFSKNGV